MKRRRRRSSCGWDVKLAALFSRCRLSGINVCFHCVGISPYHYLGGCTDTWQAPPLPLSSQRICETWLSRYSCSFFPNKNWLNGFILKARRRKKNPTSHLPVATGTVRGALMTRVKSGNLFYASPAAEVHNLSFLILPFFKAWTSVWGGRTVKFWSIFRKS